jgi:hypothetical protein
MSAATINAGDEAAGFKRPEISEYLILNPPHGLEVWNGNEPTPYRLQFSAEQNRRIYIVCPTILREPFLFGIAKITCGKLKL